MLKTSVLPFSIERVSNSEQDKMVEKGNLRKQSKEKASSLHKKKKKKLTEFQEELLEQKKIVRDEKKSISKMDKQVISKIQKDLISDEVSKIQCNVIVNQDT